MQQADDFRAEVACLADLLTPLKAKDFQTKTLFKGWTIDDILGHLHMFDHAALLTLDNRDKFNDFFAAIAKQLAQGKPMVETQYPWLDGLSGLALRDAWMETALQVADRYADVDPKLRLAWAGPDMSAKSCITARQMETWAHGQAIFDVLGQTRDEGDRIKNICHLGVTTFGWTFINRQMPVPDPAPFVQLTSPSGQLWEWNDPQPDNCVKGSAVEFAQVVAQTRNIADTGIKVVGQSAKDWMALTQCFAGPPNDPPAAGSRFKT